MNNRDAWSGRLGFTLATVGSAVGLGSIWKFPYEVGTNGGGAFILFYVAGLVLVVVPLMFAEFAIGRRGKSDPVTSIENLSIIHGAARAWKGVGALGVVTSFLILSYYSVIGGWTIAFAAETVLSGLPAANAPAVQSRFDALMGSPVRLASYHAMFMIITAVIVGRGVMRGIEAASRVLMPLLIGLSLALTVYSLVEGDLAGALRFPLRPEWSNVTARVALEALGLGFFSIGVGLSVMITYAAYASPDINLKQVAIISVVADTAISLLAGLAVFPIVFAHKLDPAAGAGLVFVTLPLAFAAMPLGTLAAIAFFTLLFVAAMASAMSLLELPVSLLIRRFGWGRGRASAVMAFACFILGLATVLSFNRWSGWFPLGRIPVLSRSTFFDLLDHLTSNLLLPASGLALAILTGWVLPVNLLAQELQLGERGAAAMRWLLRYVVPAAIAAVSIGLLIP